MRVAERDQAGEEEGVGCLRHLAWRRDERTARIEESLVEREQLASVGGEEDLVYEYTGPDTKRAIDE